MPRAPNFPLLELRSARTLDVKSQPDRARQLVGVREAQIREDVTRAFLELDSWPLFLLISASSFASLYRCLIKSTSCFGVAMPFFDFF